jgi:hypothetical protein
MEPRAFLQLAQQLSRDTTNEASLRSSVSRGYYALFNLMAQFVNENVEGLSHSAEDHNKVYRYFNNCGIGDLEAIASRLNDLRADRNESDYRLHSDKFRNQNVASLLFMKARTAFNSFESVTQSSKRRKHIVKAIQKYKQGTNQ